MDKQYKKQEEEKTFSALSLAWSLGYSIALPLVAFGLLGRWLDNVFGTSPWLLLIGIFFAVTVSSWLVFKKAMEIIKTE